MIDFNQLICKVASGASVGIGVEETDKHTFYLPIGYAELRTADAKKQAFFELYRLFKAYVVKNKLDETKDIKPSTNGTYDKQGGYSIKVKDTDEDTMLYPKINFLDTIIDAFDPNAITNIANRRLYSEEFNLTDALNHLDDALFLSNGAFMVDQAIVEKKHIVLEPSELAQMFCFIYCDIKTQLSELDGVEQYHQLLALQFKEAHLFANASLFESDTLEQVKTTLKDRLALIDQQTPLKDAEYWKLHDAIYAFLYGSPVLGCAENSYWGIKNFWPIWEDLCLESVAQSMKAQVVMADTTRTGLFGDTQEIGGKSVFYREDKDNYPFKISFADKVKYLYPDLVFKSKYIDFKLDKLNGYCRILRPAGTTDSFTLLLTSFVMFHGFKPQDIKGYWVVFSNKTESLVQKELDRINQEISLYIFDFKYKKDVSPEDVLKQRFYLLSTKQFSFAEFWLPSSDKDCNNGTPLSFGDFNDNTRQDIKTRKINIQNLVKHYVGG